MRILIPLSIVIVIAACKSNTETTKTNTVDNGKRVYNKYCLSCHQANGNGVPGMYPPLSETKQVNGDKEQLISIVLNGLSGPIEVKGQMYDNLMAPHNNLSDNDIADVLTYIRSNFGNHSDAVLPDEVLKTRKKQTP